MPPMKKALGWAAIATLATVLLAALALAVALRPPAPPVSASREFVLPGVTVVNPGRERRQAVDLAVSDARIAAISSRLTGERLDRYAGAFVLPGLIDLHTHLPPDNALGLIPHSALLYLAHGVTSIRESGDLDGTSVEAARRGMRDGDFPGPRLFACGPFVGGASSRWSNTWVVSGPEAAAAAVKHVQEAGFDCLKIYDGIDAETVRALVREATLAGLPAVGHVPGGVGYEEVLLPDTLHLLGVPPPGTQDPNSLLSRKSDWDGVDDARIREIVQLAAEEDLANTPTLVVSQQLLHYEDYEAARRDPAVRMLPRFYRDVVWSPAEGIRLYRGIDAARLTRARDALEKKLRIVGQLYRAGARLRLGTDVGQPFVAPGISLQQEMALFVAAGVPVEEVWAMATRRAGRALGMPRLGSLEPGAPADLLIFRQDPTRDLAALDSLEAVVADGRLYTREALAAGQTRWQEHFDGAILDSLSVLLTRRLIAGLESR